jgi:Spy/CpxP family protein refolding chaperone
MMKRFSTGMALIFLLFSFVVFPEKASSEPWQGQGRMRGGDFPSKLEELVDLTPEQKEQLKEMRKGCLEERWDFQDKMRRMRLELDELTDDFEAHEDKVGGLIDEMAKLRASHLKNSLRHKNEFKKIFTPEQWTEIEKAKKRAFSRRAWRQSGISRNRSFSRSGIFPFRGRTEHTWRREGCRERGFMRVPRW